MRLSAAVRAVLALAMLGFVLTRVDLHALWAQLTHFDTSIAVAMLVMNAALMMLFAARWRAVAASLGIEAPYARFLCGTWVGAFASQFGPAVVLNEVSRFRVLLSHAEKGPLAASQLLDRVSGQLVLATIVVLLTPYYLHAFGSDLRLRIAWAAGLMVGVCVLLVALALVLVRRLRVHTIAARKLLDPRTSPAHYVCSFGIQSLLTLNLWLAARGLDASAPGMEICLAAPLILGTLTLLPLSVADWGSREAAALVFLSATGLSAETIVAASIVYGGMALLGTLPAMAIWARNAGMCTSASRASDAPPHLGETSGRR